MVVRGTCRSGGTALPCREVAVNLTDDELELLRSAFDWARQGDSTALQSFLDIGGPVDLTNDRGDTLLILASYYSHLESVKVLLAAGADLDRANDNGQTALGAAVFRRCEGIVRALLAAGADPHGGARSAVAVAEFFELDDMAALLTER